jgi:transcriptional antiterminator NusG
MSKQDMQQGRNWYAIHTYAGYENAVMRNLKQRAESLNMTEKIFNVVVPTEKVVKIKGTKKVEVEDRIYPGYVLVDMIVDDDSWYVVRNTPRVTGFVGSGTTPVPVLKKKLTSYSHEWKVLKRQNTLFWLHQEKLLLLLTDHSKILKVVYQKLIMIEER